MSLQIRVITPDKVVRKISSNEIELISNHPLLNILQPENSTSIKNIMNNSLK